MYGPPSSPFFSFPPPSSFYSHLPSLSPSPIVPSSSVDASRRYYPSFLLSFSSRTCNRTSFWNARARGVPLVSFAGKGVGYPQLSSYTRPGSGLGPANSLGPNLHRVVPTAVAWVLESLRLAPPATGLSQMHRDFPGPNGDQTSPHLSFPPSFRRIISFKLSPLH